MKFSTLVTTRYFLIRLAENLPRFMIFNKDMGILEQTIKELTKEIDNYGEKNENI